MKYEDALKEWGARKIEAYEARYAEKYIDGRTNRVDRSFVAVDMEFDEGYSCCGGSDPLCYCSLAESPRAEVVITAPGHARVTMHAEDFDFVRVLGEIVEAGGGTVTGEEA